MKPAYSLLRSNFSPSPIITRDAVLSEIGWEDLIGDTTYWNTCAIRMSLALIKSGVTVPGRMPIKKGPHRGKLIEPGQARLSGILARTGFFGPPEKYTIATAKAGIGSTRALLLRWRHSRVTSTL